MAKRLYVVLFALCAICGCGVISPLRTSTPTPTPTSGGKLYVSTNSSILRFGNALTANTNVGPEVTINGSTSQLNTPQRILLDVSTDRLFVANKGAGSVLIFSPASQATATSTPSAVLTSTGNMTAPVDLAIDRNNNLLYVADGSNILVFTQESGFSGNVNATPSRSITVNFTIAAIFLDAPNNNLFIVDQADNSVGILQNASTQAGQVQLLLAQITGSATTLNSPNGVVLDGNGRIIVNNRGSSPGILIFTGSGLSVGGNNISPLATISGASTRIGVPQQMVFNSGANNGELYVADSQAPGILIFTNVTQASGNISSAPARAISGTGTGLNANAINGVALDTTR
jgi:hypothetical protein